MAPVINVLRTCGILFYFVIQVHAVTNNTVEPWIVSLQVEAKSCVDFRCKYLLLVRGSDYLGYHSWKLTPKKGLRGDNCDVIYPNYELNEIETSQFFTKIQVLVPDANETIYFCLRHTQRNSPPIAGRWIHQGEDLFIHPKSDAVFTAKNKNTTSVSDNLQLETQSNLQESNTSWGDLTHDIDVNYLPKIKRPTREESDNIEIFINDNYIPFVIKENSDNDYNAITDVNSVKSKYNSNNVTAIKSIGDYENDNNLTENIVSDIDSNVINNRLKRGITNDNDNNKILSKAVINIASDVKSNSNNNKLIEDNNSVIESILEKKREIVRPYSELIKNSTTNSKLINNRFKREIIRDTNYTKTLSKDSQNSINITENSTVQYILFNNRSKREIIKDTDYGEKHTPGFIVDNYNEETDSNNNSYLVINKLKREIIKDEKYKGKISKDGFGQEPKMEDILLNDGVYGNQDDVVNPQISDFSVVRSTQVEINLDGLRIETSDKDPKIIEDGIPSVLAESRVTVRLFGQGLTPRTVIAFTHDALSYGQPCKFLLKGEYMAMEDSVTASSALFEIIAPLPIISSKLYICAKNLKLGSNDPSLDQEKYLHQGTESFKIIATHTKLLPLWATLILILTCLTFSALFSGLNLGLMSLNKTELKIISNTGTEQERKYARAIMPVRDHGNYLLCSILLGNVAVNSTFTILLDDLTSGLFAVIFSTLAIVLLGEITPQAICSRHGLMIGARSIIVTKGVMALTAPLAFPVSKLLDYFLGEEIGSVYNRERLKELVKVTTDMNDLDRDEVNIISGALELRKKKVSDVMTKMEDVFMLPITSILDFETMSEIVKSGYSRIPVYEGHRGNIVTVLFIKDLAFVDPDDNTPLRTLCRYYQNPCNFVFEDVTLDVMFKQFKEGNKGHMAFIHRINNEGEGDPFYETIGLVTLEDVIEEMIQAEIVDETDVFMDNRSKRRRNKPQHKLQDFAAFAERHENQRIHISPQLTLATFQFLSTSVDVFKPDIVSETVLRRLLRQDVIQFIKVKGKSKKEPSTYVYQQGKPVDYFVLVLEGRVEVTVGRENLVFEAGPFTYFGVQALTQNVGVAESPTPSAMGSLQNLNMDSMLRHTFVPDYSVRAITELYYLTVKRSLYLAAKRATLMEKGALSKGATNEQFDTEVDKNLDRESNTTIDVQMKQILRINSVDTFPTDSMSVDKLFQSVDEDISISGEHKTPSRQVSPNPPVSASPVTRASFASRTSPERNGDVFAKADEQEKLLKH